MTLKSRETVHLTNVMSVADSTLADQRRRKFWNRPTVTPVDVVLVIVRWPQMCSSWKRRVLVTPRTRAELTALTFDVDTSVTAVAFSAATEWSADSCP